MNSPRFFLSLGLVLLFSGWIVPLLMVMHVIPSTFTLNFLGWTSSVTGLFLGLIGAAMMVRERKE
jgi:hypothetical protein